MTEKPSGEVRRRALVHALVSGVVTALLVALLVKWQEAGGNPRRGVVLATAVPAAWFLIQMAVLATGVPFVRMAKKWDSLTGCQRFILSMAILAIAAVVLLGIGFTVAISLVTS